MKQRQIESPGPFSKTSHRKGYDGTWLAKEGEGYPVEEEVAEGEPLKGRGLHRAMQIQELSSKQMALELLLHYIVKDREAKVDPEILQDIVNDLKTVKDLFRDIRWTRRLDAFGINPQLEDLADSPNAQAEREKLDLELIKLSKEYVEQVPLDIGKFIESTTEAILNSNHPATHRSLASLLDAFRETNQLQYGEIVLSTIRRSRLPWTQQTIYAVLFFFEGTGDSQSFMRFVTFLCGGTASENGLRKWFWTRVPGQRTVPCPPGSRYPGLVSRLITTSMATGQTDYAKAYLQKLLYDGYGLSPKLIWFLMVDFMNYRDWAGAREFLQQICEGHVPITPEVTTTKGLQRFVMSCLQILLKEREETLYSDIISVAVKHDIPPFKPSTFTFIKGNWARILTDWDDAYLDTHSGRALPSPSSQTTEVVPDQSPTVNTTGARTSPNAKAFFLDLSRTLQFSPDAPGFVYHSAMPFDIRTGSHNPTDIVEKLIPGERSIWNWNRIRASVAQWGHGRSERTATQTMDPDANSNNNEKSVASTAGAADTMVGKELEERQFQYSTSPNNPSPPPTASPAQSRKSRRTITNNNNTSSESSSLKKSSQDTEEMEKEVDRLAQAKNKDRGFRRAKLDVLMNARSHHHDDVVVDGQVEGEGEGEAAVVGVGH